MSWWSWVGSDGDVLGLDRFGASAPGTTVLEKLGFTAENIAARARALLAATPSDPKEATMPADQNLPSAAPLGARAERVGRLPLARVDPRRAPAGADRRLLGRRRDLEPDDLPEGDDRGRRLRRAAARARRRRAATPSETFWALAEQDIREACDLFRPVWDGGGGRDGYVSLEVDPRLAYDTLATFREAMRLHETVDRPNLMVKIPATKPGLAAIEDVIAKGRSINVTLIFSLRRYAEVAESYMRGLERLVAEGGDPRKVASVASFFVSRIDTEADRRLEEIGGHDELKGKLAIANAKLAYAHYQEVFAGPALGVPGAARARRRSACCGRRPRPRTPTTRTRCTSRS